MQMSQSIFGKGLGGWLCSYAILPWYISVAVKRAIQLAWNKNCSIAFISKSKKKKIEEEEEERKWMYHFLPPHNSFSVDPSTEMFTDSYHSPSFSHLCLDMFQKTGPFHLPSRCEEICSLMAFKTGSADNKKKGEVRRTLRSPVTPPHPHPSSFSRRILCGAECCGTLLLCHGANCASHTDLHLQATWYHLFNRRVLPLNGFAQSQWSLNGIQGSGLELCFKFVCYCILCSQLLCYKKKSFITKLNTKTVVLEECTQEYITANVQIIPLSGKLETILKKKLFIYFKTSLYQWPSEE